MITHIAPEHDTRDISPEDVLSDDPVQILTHAKGPSGSVPFTEDFLTNGVQRRSLRDDPERGHGLESGRAAEEAVRDTVHGRRTQGAGRHPDRARTAHRPLRAVHHGRGRREGAAGAESHPVRAVLLGPVRRTHPGHHRDAGLAAISQRRGPGVQTASEVAPNIAWSHGCRVLRQGPARDDDGAGRYARQAGGDRSWRRDSRA